MSRNYLIKWLKIFSFVSKKRKDIKSESSSMRSVNVVSILSNGKSRKNSFKLLMKCDDPSTYGLLNSWCKAFIKSLKNGKYLEYFGSDHH